MTSPDTLLILLGAVLISVALLRALRFAKRLGDAALRRPWRLLTILMVLFVVGYGAAIGLLVADQWQLVVPLMALIFAAGGGFVLLSVAISERLAGTLLDDSERLERLITERTDELAQARRKAEESSHAKSRHLAQMSHELRTPLNSVVGFTNVLRKNRPGNLDEKQRLYLDRILDNGKRLLSLVNDILDLSKIEAGHVEVHPEELDLEQVLSEVLGQFGAQVQAQQKVKLLLEVPNPMAPLTGDRGKLIQILVNLVGNALKFTRRGLVRVRVVVEAQSRRPVGIEVVDTGIGIPPDKLDAIFEPFRQADAGIEKDFGGTGLGLGISRSLCHLLGWELSAASDGKSGSTFRIQLISEPAEALEGPQFFGASSQVPALTDLRLEQTMRGDLDGASALLVGGGGGLAQEIRRLGLAVLTAEDGEEALAAAEGLAPDLWIVDATSNEGAELLEHLATTPRLGTPGLLVIAEDEAQVPEAAVHLRPPITPVRLLGHLWKVQMAGEREDSESLAMQGDLAPENVG